MRLMTKKNIILALVFLLIFLFSVFYIFHRITRIDKIGIDDTGLIELVPLPSNIKAYILPEISLKLKKSHLENDKILAIVKFIAVLAIKKEKKCFQKIKRKKKEVIHIIKRLLANKEYRDIYLAWKRDRDLKPELISIINKYIGGVCISEIYFSTFVIERKYDKSTP